MDFGIAGVAAITVICYLVGMGCKAAKRIPDEVIPVACGVAGAALGIVGMCTMPDFPAKDAVNALQLVLFQGWQQPVSIRQLSSSGGVRLERRLAAAFRLQGLELSNYSFYIRKRGQDHGSIKRKCSRQEDGRAESK